jgi:hypothetical protein
VATDVGPGRIGTNDTVRPLFVEGDQLGAMSLYSRTAGAFDDGTMG